jgi:hypothetical protein
MRTAMLLVAAGQATVTVAAAWELLAAVAFAAAFLLAG